MTPDERAAALYSKVEAFFTGGNTWSWTTGSVTYEVSQFTVIDRGVELFVNASDASGELPTNNPYRFINPPTTVTNGANEELAAARRMVEDAVLSVARSSGWAG